MSSAVAFPAVKPNSRSYEPGTYPSNTFESLDGTKTHLRYGNKRVNATLTLGFQNISDAKAALIIENYEEVNSTWSYVTFSSSDGVAGVSDDKEVAGQTNPDSSLRSLVREGGEGLLWRYSKPPKVTNVYPGISNVTCSFVACLDAP